MTDLSPNPAAASGETPYRVRLNIPSSNGEESFEGPLDLLLRLIEKQELDITKVSLVLVTDQYLDYMRQSEHVNPDNLADFLVVAAKLLLIKSRALLPGPPATGLEEEEDVGDELARQLLEYKKLKELAEQLKDRDEQGLRAYLRVSTTPDLERQLDMTGVTLGDLLAAAREALSLVPSKPVNNVVQPFAITVADRARHIEGLLARRGRLSFQRLLRKATSRSEIIVTFLALLELIKRHRARAEQDRLFGEITVLAVEQPPGPAETAAPADSAGIEETEQ
ncbi:MAG: Segregation and condensation protein A [Chloroflexi bacterium ADurb.Bin180]|nr:MAG: Segregation and condensation protein A [Chloroflexi bacterium ADurb.Bin180]